MNTSLHAICDSQRRPGELFVTTEQVSEHDGGLAFLDALQKVEREFGDCGCNADWFRDAFLIQRDTRLDPWRSATQTPVDKDTRRYKWRNRPPRRKLFRLTGSDQDHVQQVQGFTAFRDPPRPMSQSPPPGP